MIKESPLVRFLETQGVLILDGGLATELENRGHDLNHHLWSARLLMSDPDQIRQVHLAYLMAGAECIISASYQASIQGFMTEGLSRKRAESLIKSTVRIARDARDFYSDSNENTKDSRPHALVAASVGPYGAYLADGSEYQGKYNISSRVLYAFHESRWEILAQTNPDLFACETIPSVQEAKILHDLLYQTPGIEAWISFSCKDANSLSDGTPIESAVSIFKDCEQVVAIGINCTAPRFITPLIKKIYQTVPEKLIVVYPNSGEIYNAKNKQWVSTSDPVDFAKVVKEWYGLGAKLIGGCCRTGPEHIRAIKNALIKPAINNKS